MNDSEKIEKIKVILRDVNINLSHEEIENEVLYNVSPKASADLICGIVDYFNMIKEIVYSDN